MPRPSLDSPDCGVVKEASGSVTLRDNDSVEDGSELIRVYLRGYEVDDLLSECAIGGIGDVTMAGESPPGQLAGRCSLSEGIGGDSWPRRAGDPSAVMAGETPARRLRCSMSESMILQCRDW
jgi:hypothetical protein